MDEESYKASYAGTPLKLTPNEFRLLHLLASRPGQVLRREQLLESLHGTAGNFDRSVDSHIKNLRKKLQTVSGQPMIETVYGVGYRFVEATRQAG